MAGEEVIMAAKCTGECGGIFIPPRATCPKCGVPNERYECLNNGKLLTYTVLNTVPEGFEAPLIIGMVAFKNGAKLVCMGDCNEQDLEIDKSVLVNNKDERYFFVLEK